MRRATIIKPWMIGLAVILFIGGIGYAIAPFRASGGIQMATQSSWQGATGVPGVYYKTGSGMYVRNPDNSETGPLGTGGGGVTWPLTNGTTTNTYTSSIVDGAAAIGHKFDTTNAFSTAGDILAWFGSGGVKKMALDISTFSAPYWLANGTSTGQFTSGTSGWQAVDATSFQIWLSNSLKLQVNGTTMNPSADGAMSLGAGNVHYQTVWAYTLGTGTGSSIASAATISPVAGLFHLTGTTSVSTINLPVTSFTGQITIICDAACVFATGGNINTGFTGTTGKAYSFWYDGTKWYVQAGG